MSNTDDIMNPSGGAAEKRYLNVNQISAYLGISRYMVSRMIRLREIPFIPYGKAKRFDRDAIDAWVSKRTIKVRS